MIHPPLLQQVFYNKLDTSVTPITTATVATATPGATYQFATVLADPGTGPLGSLLFPGDATVNSSALGFMQAFLSPVNPLAGAAPSRLISLMVSCTGCQLLLDGIVVVDVFEPIASGSVTAITKMSTCITINNFVVSL